MKTPDQFADTNFDIMPETFAIPVKMDPPRTFAIPIPTFRPSADAFDEAIAQDRLTTT